MSNYTRGRAKEYKLKNFLIAKGYEVFRSAGSHGVADLVAISKNGHVYFIQLKTRKLPPRHEMQMLEDFGRRLQDQCSVVIYVHMNYQLPEIIEYDRYKNIWRHTDL